MSIVDDYLMNVAEPQRGQLERIRHIVHETVPDADEANRHRRAATEPRRVRARHGHDPVR
jgi:hypothetical protein